MENWSNLLTYAKPSSIFTKLNRTITILPDLVELHLFMKEPKPSFKTGVRQARSLKLKGGIQDYF